MGTTPGGSRLSKSDGPGFLARSRRAFSEFLTIPSLTIAALLLAALVTNTLDRARVTWLEPLAAFLRSSIFTEAGATADFLGVIAGGMFTLTTITISMLLISLQQASGYLSDQVIDQFLHRRRNQAFFGFFIGVTLFVLIIHSTVTESFIPAVGALASLLLAAAALYLLILLLYTTIYQMRPEVIVRAVHDHTLAARVCQLDLLRRTRRSPCFQGTAIRRVVSGEHGYVTAIRLEPIAAAVSQARGEVEVVLWISIGSFVGFGDGIAEVQAIMDEDAERVASALPAAIQLDNQREIGCDPAYGLEQLEMIAWTSISTSKSNPEPGLLTIRSLRDILSRWLEESDVGSDSQALPVVYSDNVLFQLMDKFESLAVVSSESMQHQNFTEVVHTIAVLFGRLTPELQQRAEDLVLRILPVMGDHALTSEMEAALAGLVRSLRVANRPVTAKAVQSALNELKVSIGHLHSRSTRVRG